MEMLFRAFGLKSGHCHQTLKTEFCEMSTKIFWGFQHVSPFLVLLKLILIYCVKNKYFKNFSEQLTKTAFKISSNLNNGNSKNINKLVIFTVKVFY